MITTENAQKVAKFWSQFLTSKFAHDNGCPDQMALANSALFAPTKVSLSQVEVFEVELAKLLIDFDDSMVAVDYHPDDILVEAAAIAGFEIGMGDLPFKTCVNLDSMKCKVGYNGKWQDL